MKKKIVGIIVCMLLIGTGVSSVSGIELVEKTSMPTFHDENTLYVGGSGLNNYTNIQDAIDDASDGDTVFVYDDSSPYYENLIVNKSINLIGEGKNTTVIDGNWNESYVLRITSDVNISGFMIINSGNGMEMWSNHSIIDGNIITNNIWNGIYLYKSHDIHIMKNNINNNGGCGIHLAGSSDNLIMENEIKNHNDCGIRLDYSIHNNISRNIISNSSWNILFHFYSSGNIIRNNIISGGWNAGILIMYGSDDNTICGNTIVNSGWIGLKLETSGNIVCHNNFIKNKVKHASFVRITLVTTLINYNNWDRNYWDNWIGLTHPSFSKIPKIIVGIFTRSRIHIPAFAFDWHPAQEPYDI